MIAHESIAAHLALSAIDFPHGLSRDNPRRHLTSRLTLRTRRSSRSFAFVRDIVCGNPANFPSYIRSVSGQPAPHLFHVHIFSVFANDERRRASRCTAGPSVCVECGSRCAASGPAIRNLAILLTKSARRIPSEAPSRRLFSRDRLRTTAHAADSVPSFVRAWRVISRFSRESYKGWS